jgi:hypothetical protein
MIEIAIWVSGNSAYAIHFAEYHWLRPDKLLVVLENRKWYLSCSFAA